MQQFNFPNGKRQLWRSLNPICLEIALRQPRIITLILVLGNSVSIGGKYLAAKKKEKKIKKRTDAKERNFAFVLPLDKSSTYSANDGFLNPCR